MSEFEAMNAGFAANRAKLVLPPRPVWLKPTDGLSKLYDEFPKLMSCGRVCRANLVQANKSLFRKQPLFSRLLSDASAAEIVYRHNLPENAPAADLEAFTHMLFKYKDRPAEEIPEWLREAAAVITDEYDRSRVVISAVRNGGFSMDLTMQAIIVFRRHLPNGVIRGNVLPIIAAPNDCEAAMILPCKLWTKAFLRQYNNS